MKKLILFSLVVLLTCVLNALAQSGRGNPSTGGKANQRAPQPSPTPIPDDLKAESATDQNNASDEGQVIKVDTQLVTVPVRVLDKKGRFAGGLAKENFKVLDDGIEQEISYFSNERQPFTVALMLDMSYSTTFKINEIQSAAIAFIDQLSPQDKVMVISFDQEVRMLCEATNDRQKIYRAIKSTKVTTGTSLYEAFDLVINDRMKSIEGRKAIILFTDGVDTSSTRVNDLTNLGDALEVDALIYPIRYDTFADVQTMKNKPVITKPPVSTGPFPGKNPTGNPLPFPVEIIGMPSDRGTSAEDYKRAQDYLDQLAVRTGGQLYEANTMGSLSGAFSKVASELREYYSLGFYPKEDAIKIGKVRKLKVKVDRTGLAVRARDSYVVGKKQSRKK